MALEKYPIGRSIIDLVSAHRAVTTTKISKIGLHAGQDVILLTLLEKDGQSQNSLVQELCANHSAIAKSVARMQKSQIVRTENSAIDKRVTLVYLTSKGHELALQAQKIWYDVEGLALQNLSPVDQGAFVRIVTTVEQNFATAGQSFK